MPKFKSLNLVAYLEYFIDRHVFYYSFLWLKVWLCLGLYSGLTISASANESMTMCVDHYPPLQVISTNGEVTGENVEITKALVNKLGYTLTFTPDTPFLRCLLWLEDGKVDLVAGILDSPQRREKFHLFLYDDLTDKTFFVKKGNLSITSFEDLRGLRIGVVRGVKQFAQFDDAPEHFFRLVEVNTLPAAFGMLSMDRVDAVLSTDYYGQHIIQQDPQMSKTIIQADYQVNQDTQAYIALSKKSVFARRLKDFEDSTEKMLSSGEFTQIIIDFQQNHPEYYDLPPDSQ
jgi:polar amino acid transport system substrate-binding protein